MRKISRYIPPHHYTSEELDDAAISDLLNDARCSEEQAITGPFWPDRNITTKSLLAYAASCRDMAEQYRNGGAHKAVLKPGWLKADVDRAAKRLIELSSPNNRAR